MGIVIQKKLQILTLKTLTNKSQAKCPWLIHFFPFWQYFHPWASPQSSSSLLHHSGFQSETPLSGPPWSGSIQPCLCHQCLWWFCFVMPQSFHFHAFFLKCSDSEDPVFSFEEMTATCLPWNEKIKCKSIAEVNKILKMEIMQLNVFMLDGICNY